MGILDGWQYCPRCRGDLRAVEGHLTCSVCGEHYWANPSPAVQALVEHDGRVLLARRGIEPRRGHWDLPGGFVDESESPLAALRRELQEETGLELENADLLRIDIEPYDDRFVFSVTYLARAGGTPAPADDVTELRWFAAEELPDEMAFPGQHALLADWAGIRIHSNG